MIFAIVGEVDNSTSRLLLCVFKRLRRHTITSRVIIYFYELIKKLSLCESVVNCYLSKFGGEL